MTDDTDTPVQATACPDCGRAPGAKGRIRHDEFCPRRTGARPTVENGNATERAPRARGPRGFDRTKTAADIYEGIGAIQGVVFGMVRPDWAGDALTPEESQALSVALADEIATNKRLREWLKKLQDAGPHARLAFVLTMIALPRLARHGMVPSFGGGQDRGEPGSPPSTYSTGHPVPDEPQWIDLDMTDGHAAVPPVEAAA